MITARQALDILKGPLEEKKKLFDKLVHWSLLGELPEWGAPVLETLRKELMPEKKVVEMTATMKGVGGAGI